MRRKLKDLASTLVAAVDSDAGVFGAAYLVLLPFYLWPLLVTPLLPGLDLPFHLSMVDMLSKAARPDSPYAPFYQATPMLAPYATHYLALWILGKVVTLTTAHKIIVGIYVAGLPLAAASLLGVAGRSRIPAVLAFPLAYNLTLHYGFISSALSLPVVLLVLAELTRFLLGTPAESTLGESPRTGLAVWRWVATALAALLLFLCHLQNFLYGMCAGLAFVVLCRAPWRRRLLGAAAFLPSLAALAWWQRHSPAEGPPGAPPTTLAYAWKAVKLARLEDLDGGRRSVLRDVMQRLVELPGHALRSFSDGVDVVAARALLAIIAFYFCLGLAGRLLRPRGGRPRPPRMVVASWVAFAGALCAYLALPHHLRAFDLMTFFPRFAPLAMAMMLPLVPAGLKRFDGKLRLALPLPALLLCLIYGRELVRHYRLYAGEVADFVAVMDRAEPGKKALGLVFDRQSHVMHIESAFLGMPELYTALKPAPQSMTPLWYCGMKHIPCRPTPKLGELPDPGPWQPNRLDPARAVRFFDYFFVRSPPAGALFKGQQSAVELVMHRGTWWLYRRRASAPPPPPSLPPAPAPAKVSKPRK